MMPSVERMSPEMDFESSSLMEEPRDLSVKRKMKPVPPPLDLSKRTLEPEVFTGIASQSTASPQSPSTQKNLPLRKRAYSWSYQPEMQGMKVPTSVIKFSIELNETSDVNICDSGGLSSSMRISGLPTPHTPHTPHPHSAIPVISTASRFDFENNSPTQASTSLHPPNQGPLNLTTSVSGIPSSLLSPAPSFPSSCSLNSSREELDSHDYYSHHGTHRNSPHRFANYSPAMPHSPYIKMDCSSSSSSEQVHLQEQSAEPALSSHQWPTTVWSVLMAGVQVHFVLANGQLTSARMSEELGELEETHQHRYAPHGLHLLQILYLYNDIQSPNPPPTDAQNYLCQLIFQPYMAQQQDIMVVIPPHHPFFVHSKGWCSISAEHACERYNLPCQSLEVGDLCLPLYHTEVTDTSVYVATPDLADAMKKFDFNDDTEDRLSSLSIPGNYSAPSSATFAPHTQRSVFLSPPASPSKKTLSRVMEGPNASAPRPRRPMNGFMLFAKHHRLKLIQQYPGKDNRAISVLLGGMWKSLPEVERERFNLEARVQAEERKRLDPDCWKRKRSHSTS